MSIFQAELDLATLTFDKTLETECRKLFEATNYSIATAETISKGIIGNTLQSITKHKNNYVASILCKSPLEFKRFFALDLNSKNLISESLAINIAQGVSRSLNTSIGLSCIGLIGYQNQDSVAQAKVCLGFSFNNNLAAKTLELTGTKPVIFKQIIQASLAYLKNYFIKFAQLNKSKEVIK